MANKFDFEMQWDAIIDKMNKDKREHLANKPKASDYVSFEDRLHKITKEYRG